MKPKRWQDWVNVVIGLWLVASPWALGFADERAPALTAWALGAAVVAFSALGAYIENAWEETINVLLGLLLMGAPWLLEFADRNTPTSNIALSGLLVTVFAVLAMLRNLDLRKLREMRQPPAGSR